MIILKPSLLRNMTHQPCPYARSPHHRQSLSCRVIAADQLLDALGWAFLTSLHTHTDYSSVPLGFLLPSTIQFQTSGSRKIAEALGGSNSGPPLAEPLLTSLLERTRRPKLGDLCRPRFDPSLLRTRPDGTYLTGRKSSFPRQHMVERH